MLNKPAAKNKQDKVEIADVFRMFGDNFIRQNKGRLMPSQLKVINDIKKCMTADMGGGRYECNDCGEKFWSYHGCRNRACPKCHGRQTADWLEKRQAEIFPCQYFHVIATAPHELNKFFAGQQKLMYGILMKVTAEALKELALEQKYLGAEIGTLSVLHTWSGEMNYHPHVHMLATGAGVESDDKTWRETPYNFLVPVKKLSPLIAKKFSAVLQQTAPELYAQIDKEVWRKEWCSYCKPYGQGSEAVIKYLARYVFRVAITNARIIIIDGDEVIFKRKDNRTGEFRIMRLSGVEFMRRFMFHVLPKGFHKVRYYGLWSASKRKLQRTIQMGLLLLKLNQQIKNIKAGKALENTAQMLANENVAAVAEEALNRSELENHGNHVKCPQCGSREVTLLETKRRYWRFFREIA